MPIEFDPKVGWEIKNPTAEEIFALQEIGKQMIVQGLAGAYTNDIYKKHLMFSPMHTYWRA